MTSRVDLQESDCVACDWCVLCGMKPMPVRHELSDGCGAHPGCVDDPVFAALLPMHWETVDD